MLKPIRHLRSDKDARKLIDSYFATASINTTPLTLSGLMLHCGFVSRQSYYDYIERKDSVAQEFTRAHLMLENHYEGLLQRAGNNGGCIFTLKNMNWADSKSVDVTSGGATINADPVNIVFEEVTRDTKDL